MHLQRIISKYPFLAWVWRITGMYWSSAIHNKSWFRRIGHWKRSKRSYSCKFPFPNSYSQYLCYWWLYTWAHVSSQGRRWRYHLRRRYFRRTCPYWLQLCSIGYLYSPWGWLGGQVIHNILIRKWNLYFQCNMIFLDQKKI